MAFTTPSLTSSVQNLVSSLLDDFNGQGNDAHELSLVRDWSFPSVTRPALTRDMEAFFLGATGASLGGWSDLSGLLEGDEESASPTWDVTLEPNKGNASQRELH